MPAPDSVKQLIDTFDNNLDFYKSGQYNEAQLRQEFLDPFFAELGWDMDNTAGLAPQYRDVIHEASIKAGSSTKAPDYAFSIHGQYKFFLEAKKPSVNVRDDTEPAYQLRRYGWSAKLPVSILTDFEEFAIYDCRTRPRPGDLPSTARLNYFKYTDYLEKWDELCATFSKQAILTGSFDKYTGDAKRHRGIETVDNAFLAEIEKWRNLLARNFALRNPTLSVRDLNFAVQKTIDRIIFLRICEDRGAENYKRLAALLDSGDIYRRLLDQFMQADARYNSGLFHFSAERGRGAPDNITPGLILDDKALKAIISTLYYPESPYEFSVLPADILGQIYEQFLGKTIRLTAGHQARIEEKPEVRKAGGVYYTPGYIVDYIVNNTLGRLLDGSDPKTPKPIAVAKAAEIKVLDPACGSGSFLIVAYQYLLDWHLRRYTADPNTNEPDHGRIQNHSAGKNPRIHQTARGQWKLTTDERKRILLCNIFGVDIDAQAVEVTKLSLLLKVIEGEAHQADWVRRRERILPDLGNNIKCGNSLIGPEFYHNEQMLLLDEETQYRVNVFDWKQGFSEIMERGGFDCVIGNPPYVFTRDRGISDEEKSYYYSHYKHQSFQLNTFGLFLEKSPLLGRNKSFIGFIIPNNWLTIDSFSKLRKFLIEKTGGLTVINIRDKVFSANVDTAIVITSKTSSKKITIGEMRNQSVEQLRERNSEDFSAPAYILTVSTSENNSITKLIKKIEQQAIHLEKVAKVSTGLKAYQRDKGKPPQSNQEKDARVFHSVQAETKDYGKYLAGVDVARYSLGWSGYYLKYGDWLAEPRRSVPFDGPRILVRQIPSKPPYCINGVFTDLPRYNDINSMVIFNTNLSFKYLLGILNSRMISFWFAEKFQKFQRKIFPQFKVKELKLFPIRSIDLNNPDDVIKYEKMISLVEGMLELNKTKTKEKNPETLRRLETRITATDRQIDRLVYDLYDLTAGEIALVESDRSAL